MNIKKWHIAGAFFTIVFGSLDHFFYHWSGEHPLVAAFSAVNESTWEHLKLLAAPVLLFSIFESIAYGRFRGGFLPAKVLSLILGMAAIILILSLIHICTAAEQGTLRPARPRKYPSAAR